MAEEIIASNKWRIPTDEFSPLCDNTLKLNNSLGLTGTPSKLNSSGACPPACEMCITPITVGSCRFRWDVLPDTPDFGWILDNDDCRDNRNAVPPVEDGSELGEIAYGTCEFV